MVDVLADYLPAFEAVSLFILLLDMGPFLFRVRVLPRRAKGYCEGGETSVVCDGRDGNGGDRSCCYTLVG